MGVLGRRTVLGGVAGGLAGCSPARAAGRWSEREAQAWHARVGWLVGCNFIPSDCVNQLEMWQAATFDAAAIARELGWAAGLGMNAARIFLHDIAWRDDPAGFVARLDRVLAAAAAHGIGVMPVLFDSCWNPDPRPGPQPPPVPGVHNSRWVQSPGAAALQDAGQHARLEGYVAAVLGAFRDDRRVLAWDVWNEPDNRNEGSYAEREPAAKLDLVLPLLGRAFAWARAAAPRQPLTSALWFGAWSSPAALTPVQRLQLEHSDVLSFHCYDAPAAFLRRAGWLQQWRRPVLCTEYMARPLGSTVASILPLARARRIGAFNWGLVAGRTQTYLPWDSWAHPYAGRAPDPWFHDLLRPDGGRPYRIEEAQRLRELTAAEGGG